MIKSIFICLVLLFSSISICCNLSSASKLDVNNSSKNKPVSLKLGNRFLESYPLGNGQVRILCTWYDLYYQLEKQPADISAKNTGRLYFISGEKNLVEIQDEFPAKDFSFPITSEVKSIINDVITLNLKGALSYTKENFIVEFSWEGTVKNGEEQAFSKVFTDPISKENRLLLIIIKANNKNDSTDPINEYRKMHPWPKEPDKPVENTKDKPKEQTPK
ncbi:MAG: hypothetical protein WC980_07340 [Candidatus Brocadiia bacterium]